MLRKEYTNKFDFVTSFMGNIAGVRMNGKWGFINKEKKLIVDVIYDEIGMFENGYCKVTKENSEYIINHYGETTSKGYYKIYEKSKNNHNNNRITNIVDKESLKDLFGLIKECGKEIVPPIYDEIKEKGKYFILKEKGKCDILINKDGEEVINNMFVRIEEITDNGNIVGLFDDYYGMINQRYEILIDFNYEKYLGIDKKTGCFVFQNDKTLYLFNQEGYFKEERTIKNNNNH